MSIELSVSNGVGIATMNRPESMNSLTAQILTEWASSIRELSDNPDVKVIVLTGAGRAFSAGMDLKTPFDGGEDMPWSNEKNPAGRLSKALTYAIDCVRTLARVNQPTIAAVNGYTVGAGMSLAAACDIRLASPQAVFSAPFVKLGLSGGDLGLSWFLPRIIGLPRATDMILNAREYSAEQALEIGLVTGIEDDVVAAAQHMGEHIGSFEPYGVMMSKRLLAASSTASLEAQFDAELTAQTAGSFTATAQSLGQQR
jgi:enoyl-CoA hydratase